MVGGCACAVPEAGESRGPESKPHGGARLREAERGRSGVEYAGAHRDPSAGHSRDEYTRRQRRIGTRAVAQESADGGGDWRRRGESASIGNRSPANPAPDTSSFSVRTRIAHSEISPAPVFFPSYNGEGVSSHRATEARHAVNLAQYHPAGLARPGEASVLGRAPRGDLRVRHHRGRCRQDERGRAPAAGQGLVAS